MPDDIVRRVLRLIGYEVSRHEFDEQALTLTLWVQQNAADPYHRCRNCRPSAPAGGKLLPKFGSSAWETWWERRPAAIVFW